MRNVLAILITVLLATSCSAPVANYEDPLAEIGHSVASGADSKFRTLTLGIVFTDNTEKAIRIAAAPLRVKRDAVGRSVSIRTMAVPRKRRDSPDGFQKRVLTILLPVPKAEGLRDALVAALGEPVARA